jgi:hypothetical protein
MAQEDAQQLVRLRLERDRAAVDAQLAALLIELGAAEAEYRRCQARFGVHRGSSRFPAAILRPRASAG